MIDIEKWVIDLLNEIDTASYNYKSFGLSLTPDEVRAIAEAWRPVTSVTIV